MMIVATLVAGALGAVLRAAAVARAPRAGTAAVNVAGTALLALVVATLERGLLTEAAAVVLGVGFAGALTTFSGWVALLVDGWSRRPAATVVLDLVLPVLVAVGAVVLVFLTVA